jgi:hypothetical protein
MSGSRLLLPLRIPELGPHLGKVITGTGREPGGLSLDGIRYRLATRVIDAAGEARRLAQHDERRAAVAALGRELWLEAWEEAVKSVGALLADRAADRIEEEARVVRMPRRLRRRRVPTADDRRALTARLGAAGAILVGAVEVIATTAANAVQATALERGEMDAWRDALCSAARRLDEAWLRLEEAVVEETARWEYQVRLVATWRKPLWPVVAVGVPALALAVWLGLVFGGYVGDPAWLSDLWQRAFAQ